MFYRLQKNFCVILFIGFFACNTFAIQRFARSKPRRCASNNNTAVDYTSLTGALKTFGFSFVKRTGNTVLYKDSKNKSMEFIAGSKQATLDGIKVFLAQPIKADGKFSNLIAKIDINKTLKPLLNQTNDTGKHLSFSNKLKIAKLITVVIDPGHGGKAKGAENKELNLVEKTLTLATALDVKSILKANGINVILTRSTDVNIGLDARASLANKKSADIFISIHYNHAPAKSACGIETYTQSIVNAPSTDRSKLLQSDKVFNKNNAYDECNTLLGFYVQSHAQKATNRPDRGVRRCRLAVLRDVNCPAVLIECGFLSNKDESKIMATTLFRQKLANGIASGIIAYVNKILRN